MYAAHLMQLPKGRERPGGPVLRHALDQGQARTGRAFGRAIYFDAGETSIALCSIALAAVAAAAYIPGGQLLLMAVIGFNAVSLVVTPRTPGGDYAKAVREPRG